MKDQTDRERLLIRLEAKDPNWKKAFELLEELAGVELSTPAIIDLKENEDEPAEVSFYWHYGDTEFLVTLDIYFLEDSTPMVEWFWADKPDCFNFAFDGTEEDGIPLTDLPEFVIQLLRDKKRV